MKKTIAFPAVLFFSFVLLSCSKSSNDSFSPSATNPSKVINANIAPGQTYTLDVAVRGELTISKQAAHYSISETGTNEKNGYLIYKYIPATGFQGIDEVLLLHKTEAVSDNYSGCNYGGSHMSNNSTSIMVKITVQ